MTLLGLHSLFALGPPIESSKQQKLEVRSTGVVSSEGLRQVTPGDGPVTAPPVTTRHHPSPPATTRHHPPPPATTRHRGVTTAIKESAQIRRLAPLIVIRRYFFVSVFFFCWTENTKITTDMKYLFHDGGPRRAQPLFYSRTLAVPPFPRVSLAPLSGPDDASL